MNTDAVQLRESLRQCLCRNEHQHWLHAGKVAPKHNRVIAYLREPEGSCVISNERQLALIEEFCKQHGYELVNIFRDHSSEPGLGLSMALDALSMADGLVALDLERFVHDHKDRLRDLKPLLHKFFCNTDRYLLTVLEGVNTRATGGQQSAMDVLSSVKSFE